MVKEITNNFLLIYELYQGSSMTLTENQGTILQYQINEGTINIKQKTKLEIDGLQFQNDAYIYIYINI